MLIRRGPSWSFGGATSLISELDRLKKEFDRLTGTFDERRDITSPAGVFPLMNITQDDENVYVRSEIPGVALSDIEVSATGNSLSISGERKIPEEDKKAKYHRRERESGSFRRVVTLPFDIDPEKVEARYTHGVLALILPKAEKAKPKKITIS